MIISLADRESRSLSHLGAEHLNAEHIESLTAHVLGTHVDDTLITKPCADGSCGNAVLTSASLCDNTSFTETLG
jgi:hypothetical protein